MRRRYTIAQLIAVVAICGVAFAALRTPSYLWSSALYTTACAAVVIAAINVVFSRGPSRAYWAGFLIAGGVYFISYSVPALQELVCPRLVTTPILDLIYPYVSPEPPGSPVLTGSSTPFLMTAQPSGGGPVLYQPTAAPSTFPSPPPVYGGLTLPAPDTRSRWTAWTEPDRAIGVGYTFGSLSLVNTQPFRQIGHSIAILLSGIFGGIYARHRFAVNRP